MRKIISVLLILIMMVTRKLISKAIFKNFFMLSQTPLSREWSSHPR